MDSGALEQNLLEQGKGPELVAALSAVFESTDMEGNPRYRDGVLKDLGRNIVCRSYASGLLELCHLAAMMDGLGLMIEDLVWGGGSPRTLIGEQRREGAIIVGGKTVEATYSDGQFAIAYSRMNYLSALAEFLVGSVGYEGMTKSFQVFRHDPSAKTVGEGANDLSRRLYAFLGDQLPPVQDMRKFQDIVEALKAAGDGDFSDRTVTDAVVLDFWREKSLTSGDGGGDWRTFQAVYQGFLRFLRALDRADDRMAVETAMPLGMDRDAGEIDPGRIADAYDLVDTDPDRSPLDGLDEPPADDIKALNKRERESIATLVDAGHWLKRLPRSYLRVETFSLAQNKITQALRRKLTGGQLAAVIGSGGNDDYRSILSKLESVADHIGLVLDASLFVLAQARHEEALGILLHRVPGLDAYALKSLFPATDNDEDDTVIVFPGTNASEHFIDLLQDPDQSGPQVAKAMDQAKKAFKRLNRQGFEERDLDDRASAFAVLGPALIDLERAVMAGIGPIATKRAEDLDDWFNEDQALFTQQFRKLYGGQDG